MRVRARLVVVVVMARRRMAHGMIYGGERPRWEQGSIGARLGQVRMQGVHGRPWDCDFFDQFYTMPSELPFDGPCIVCEY